MKRFGASPFFLLFHFSKIPGWQIILLIFSSFLICAVESPLVPEYSNPSSSTMNAVNSSANDLIEGSDSDSIGDDSPEYYQPISAEADDGELEFFNGENPNIDDYDEQFDPLHSLPNGYASYMENGVLSLDLRDDEDNIVEEDEDEEEERTREESDMAIRRAFREDESRRNAPLTPENSLRVIEAMRGISFGGIAPDWVGQIPEDQWINQLRGLTRSSQVSSAVQD